MGKAFKIVQANIIKVLDHLDDQEKKVYYALLIGDRSTLESLIDDWAVEEKKEIEEYWNQYCTGQYLRVKKAYQKEDDQGLNEIEKRVFYYFKEKEKKRVEYELRHWNENERGKVLNWINEEFQRSKKIIEELEGNLYDSLEGVEEEIKNCFVQEDREKFDLLLDHFTEEEKKNLEEYWEKRKNLKEHRVLRVLRDGEDLPLTEEERLVYDALKEQDEEKLFDALKDWPEDLREEILDSEEVQLGISDYVQVLVEDYYHQCEEEGLSLEGLELAEELEDFFREDFSDEEWDKVLEGIRQSDLPDDFQNEILTYLEGLWSELQRNEVETDDEEEELEDIDVSTKKKKLEEEEEIDESEEEEEGEGEEESVEGIEEEEVEEILDSNFEIEFESVEFKELDWEKYWDEEEGLEDRIGERETVPLVHPTVYSRVLGEEEEEEGVEWVLDEKKSWKYMSEWIGLEGNLRVVSVQLDCKEFVSSYWEGSEMERLDDVRWESWKVHRTRRLIGWVLKIWKEKWEFLNMSEEDWEEIESRMYDDIKWESIRFEKRRKESGLPKTTEEEEIAFYKEIEELDLEERLRRSCHLKSHLYEEVKEEIYVGMVYKVLLARWISHFSLDIWIEEQDELRECVKKSLEGNEWFLEEEDWEEFLNWEGESFTEVDLRERKWKKKRLVNYPVPYGILGNRLGTTAIGSTYFVEAFGNRKSGVRTLYILNEVLKEEEVKEYTETVIEKDLIDVMKRDDLEEEMEKKIRLVVRQEEESLTKWGKLAVAKNWEEFVWSLTEGEDDRWESFKRIGRHWFGGVEGE